MSNETGPETREYVGRICGHRVIRREPSTALGGLRCANSPYVSPWRTALTAGFLIALCGMAHAEPSMGRLFNTPAERSALDANRGKAAAGVAGAAALNAGNQAPPFGTPPSDIPQQGMQDPMTSPSSQMMQPSAGPMAMPPAGMPMMPPGVDPAAPAAEAPPPREQLELNGVLRTSGGRSTVWLNNVPHSGAQNKFSNRNKKTLTVTLPSGKKVLLQPGQRYDLADGRVKDVNEP